MTKFIWKMLKKVPLKKSSKPLKKGNTTLKKTKLKSRVKSKEELEEDSYERDKINAFWKYIGEVTLPFSEIDGTLLEKGSKSTIHHLKLKETYPELKYSVNNIFRCTICQHQEIHNDGERYPVVQQRVQWVEEHYDYCLRESLLWSENYDKMNKK